MAVQQRRRHSTRTSSSEKGQPQQPLGIQAQDRGMEVCNTLMAIYFSIPQPTLSTMPLPCLLRLLPPCNLLCALLCRRRDNGPSCTNSPSLERSLKRISQKKEVAPPKKRLFSPPPPVKISCICVYASEHFHGSATFGLTMVLPTLSLPPMPVLFLLTNSNGGPNGIWAFSTHT